MEGLDGTTIFWLITLGLIISGIIKLIMGDKGLSITLNVIGGVLGTLIVGCIAFWLEVPGSLLLAVLATMAILFIGNVFFVGEDTHQASPTENH